MTPFWDGFEKKADMASAAKKLIPGNTLNYARKGPMMQEYVAKARQFAGKTGTATVAAAPRASSAAMQAGRLNNVKDHMIHPNGVFQRALGTIKG